ncbi:hypothetical protein CFP56_007828 [Quercus suber]|uniref:DUF4220 domain-containing protein n=1 Tax=Quercus suber TaxID=58331 RepID=A0AAW0M5J2_QUESU
MQREAPDGRLKDICLSFALVIGLEVAFLYDHFYTTYPVFFANGFPWLRHLELIIVIIGSCLVPYIRSSNNREPNKDSNPRTQVHEAFVSLIGILIVAKLSMEVVRIFVINFSDWAKVQCLCYYARKPSAFAYGSEESNYSFNKDQWPAIVKWGSFSVGKRG